MPGTPGMQRNRKGTRLEEIGEKPHHVRHDEIPEGHPRPKQYYRDNDNYRGVKEFLEFFKAFLLRIPWPGGFFEFKADFAEEFAGFA